MTAADGAADLLRTSRPDPDAIATKSSGTDLVTDLDRAAEARIIDLLLGARPDDGVLGEEGGERTGIQRRALGHRPARRHDQLRLRLPGLRRVDRRRGRRRGGGRRPSWTSRRGERYTAALGQRRRTATASPARLRRPTDLATALVGTGFSYDADTRARQAEVLASVLPAVRDLRRSGSAALDLCAVACGRLDGFWERGLAPWDRAAGGLIAAEAGARVGTARHDRAR